MNTIDFDKENGLVPAVVQDVDTGKMLMLGYMNREAYEQTLQTGRVTFYSRSRQCLWVKGETSGNYLQLRSIKADCDGDSLLVTALPTGPVCHTGEDTCWGEVNHAQYGFLSELEATIAGRRQQPQQDSYVSSLMAKGINKVAQKVGEEAVELVIEAKDEDDERFLSEAADLLFHYLILLQAKGKVLDDVVAVLQGRSK